MKLRELDYSIYAAVYEKLFCHVKKIEVLNGFFMQKMIINSIDLSWDWHYILHFRNVIAIAEKIKNGNNWERTRIREHKNNKKCTRRSCRCKKIVIMSVYSIMWTWNSIIRLQAKNRWSPRWSIENIMNWTKNLYWKTRFLKFCNRINLNLQKLLLIFWRIYF